MRKLLVLVSFLLVTSAAAQPANSSTTTATTTLTTSSTVGNAVAGGSGFGAAFDYNLANTIGLDWMELPALKHTVEYWYMNTDLHMDQQAIVSYSAFNIRGFLSQGGFPYEAANELSFYMLNRGLVFWRGSSQVQLYRETNPRVYDGMWNDQWHHVAYTYDSSVPSVSFYLDGTQLDFGTFWMALPDSNDEQLVTEIAPFSSSFQVTEHEDAQKHYGNLTLPITFVSAPTACGDQPADANLPKEKVAFLIQDPNDADCSKFDQAQWAVASGAWIVLFAKPEPELEVVEEGEELEVVEEEEEEFWGTNLNDTFPLTVPVLAVDHDTATNITLAGAVQWVRLQDPVVPMLGFSDPVEPVGIFAMGQEPDAPWGDFDMFQSMNGVIDEFRVWNTVRTPEQIYQNYKRAIDVISDPDAQDLNIYWSFDVPLTGPPLAQVTSDSSPEALNPGLFGNLPTKDNTMTYSDGSPRRPPTAPLWLPTTACPLVGQGRFVVVPVTPGSTTVIELKSMDPDGDDLLTKIVSLPPLGRLLSYGDSSNVLAGGDTVVDSNRTENKRIIYEAPNHLGQEVAFVYSVQDSDDSTSVKTAVVRLLPHVVEIPRSETRAVGEDSLTFFSLGRPSQYTQQNMRVQISTLPTRGTLYQVQFQPDVEATYVTIAKTLNEYGPMEEIVEAGTFLNSTRGIVFYQPAPDESSNSSDQVYDSFGYKFYDEAAGLFSNVEGIQSVIVSAVNDPPISLAVNATSAIGGSSIVVNLMSSDIDVDEKESFATRSYAKITSFPFAGRLYQYNESSDSDDKAGKFLDPSVKSVPQTFAWASNVVRYSSQYSVCGEPCYEWKHPECTSNDVLSGGSPDGTCSTTSWHASQILGPPNIYPEYSGDKNGWDLGAENAGHEFLELEFPFAVYVDAFEVYETFKTGAIWKISTAAEYLDDINENCVRETCSQKTEWQTLWTKPQEQVTPGPEEATVFAPPLCPSTVKSNLVRIDLDTARVPGWNTYDAAKVTGALDTPPGLVVDTSNRLVYVPMDGVHGVDRFEFSSSDCLGVGESVNYTIVIDAPDSDDIGTASAENELGYSVFFESDVKLAFEPGEIANYELDLSPVLDKVQGLLTKKPNMTATVAWTTSLGVQEGEGFADISLDNPTLLLELGAKNRGDPFSYLELWLEDQTGLTFRIRYRTVLYIDCLNDGAFDEKHGICLCTKGWESADCSEQASDDFNLGFAIGLPVALAIIVGGAVYLFFENKRMQNDAVWHVKREELKFMEPPEVVGRGTYGLVLLAEYRGTQVAVKRAIPPKSEKSKVGKLDDEDDDKSGPRSSTGNVGMRSGSASGNVGMRSGSRGMTSASLGTASDTNGFGWLKSGTGSNEKSRSIFVSDAAKWRKLKQEFVEEMRYLAKLRHPCITTIMGAVLGEDPMLIMEYMDHGSLYDLLHNETMVMEGDLLMSIMRDITQGVRFLHSTIPQVIHGDLKSGNILIDSKFKAKVTDFGLSQKRELGGTGTPFWMAPELLRVESANCPATDAYSFGIILYEIYSRRDPYEDEDPLEVLRLVSDPNVRKRPPTPRNMPASVQSIMADCIAEEPGKRPPFEELDIRLKRIDAEEVDPNQGNKKNSTISLFDIFPRHIAEALRDGQTVEPEHRESVTIFFSDIVGFTKISSELPPQKIASMLDRLYTNFDRLSHEHDIFKVETIGDAYMAVSNLVKDQPDDHAKRIAEFAIDAIAAANETRIDLEDESKGCVNIRVGFHSGSVVADVVGTRNPRYCLFGDTVNTASRMESNSKVNRIHCSRASAKLLRSQCKDIKLTSRGKISVKGKGVMQTFWVNEGENAMDLDASGDEFASSEFKPPPEAPQTLTQEGSAAMEASQELPLVPEGSGDFAV